LQWFHTLFTTQIWHRQIYCCSPKLKETLKGQHFSSDAEVEAAVRKWISIKPKTFEAALRKWISIKPKTFEAAVRKWIIIKPKTFEAALRKWISIKPKTFFVDGMNKWIE
jgi:hypothetical protein